MTWIGSNYWKRLAASTGGLTPTRGVSSAELVELRQLLAADLRATAAVAAPARSSMFHAIAHDRIALDNIAVDTRAELERAVDASAAITDGFGVAPAAMRVARRTLPFSSSAEPDSLAEWAAGRRVERTLGPFVDRDGRLVWFDIFAIVRQVSLVRAPSATPLLTLPLRDFSLGAATSYELPAGSVWILSRALSAAAPAGAYSGVRIKKGRLRLSSVPTIAGLTLTIPNGARLTLELELDPAASTAPAATPGQDAHASRAKVPETATFVFTAAGGVLRTAGDAGLKVFGATFALQRKAAAATYEASLNRVLFPFDSEPAELAIASSRSKLFEVAGSARVTLSAWALPVAVIEPSQLGHASGAGALVLGTEAGLSATWRGLATNPGSPVALGSTFVLAETDRVVILASDATGVAATQALRLWRILNSWTRRDPSQF